MDRAFLTLVGLAATILTAVATAQNAVTEWNNIAVATASAGNSVIPPNIPNGMALYLAHVQCATDDALNAIEHRFELYGPKITAGPLMPAKPRTEGDIL